MVGQLLSFLENNFSGYMLNFRVVYTHYSIPLKSLFQSSGYSPTSSSQARLADSTGQISHIGSPISAICFLPNEAWLQVKTLQKGEFFGWLKLKANEVTSGNLMNNHIWGLEFRWGLNSRNYQLIHGSLRTSIWYQPKQCTNIREILQHDPYILHGLILPEMGPI